MIKTLKQAQEAISEIQAITGWTENGVAKEAGMHPSAINKLVTGETKNPAEKTRKKLDRLLVKVRKL